MAAQRTAIPLKLKIEVLTEAGYRCAVPACRNILALDLHHIVEVKEGGPNEVWNLLTLCPMCHALYTRGEIRKESIDAWKTMLVALNHTFDKESISNLLFLKQTITNEVAISGDGVLKFSHLIASGLATHQLFMQNGPLVLYVVRLTDKGNRIIEAWYSGNREQVRQALQDISQQ